MRKDMTELVFILDRSGSMSGLESDTIGGFNSMLKKQKAEPGEAVVTTVLFDSTYELLHDRFPMEQVKPITDKDYFTMGCTALLDAVGSAIQKTINAQKHMLPDMRAEKVIFVIITDGLENSSVEYSYKDIKRMINHQKNQYGWEFMFLGANMDAVAEAARFGVTADRAVTYECDSEGLELTYDVVGETLCAMRCTQELPVGADWKKKIEEDYKKRGRR